MEHITQTIQIGLAAGALLAAFLFAAITMSSARRERVSREALNRLLEAEKPAKRGIIYQEDGRPLMYIDGKDF